MNDDFLKVAKQAALEAGKAIAKYFGEENEHFLKGDVSDFATKADLEAEKIIIEAITKNFPTHNIISEEAGKKNKKSKYTWIIDPLDGTITFATGLPYFAVSIGLLEENVPILGVINQVMTKELYWAQKGEGAYLNGKKITVSKISDFNKAVLGVDFGHRIRRQIKHDKYILPLMNKASYLYSLGSDAVILGLIAKGILDAFAVDAWIWDFAGGVIIVEEAGGKVTDPKGRPVDWTKDRLEIVASNGLIHNQILEALKDGKI